MKKTKIEIVGNGTALNPDITSFLIDNSVLIDCSPYTIEKLMKVKIKIGIESNGDRITGEYYTNGNTKILIDNYSKIIYYIKSAPLILDDIESIFKSIKRKSKDYILSEIIEIKDGTKLDLINSIFITHRHQDHPTEEEIFEFYGDNKNIIGVHVDTDLKHFKKAKLNQIFVF